MITIEFPKCKVLFILEGKEFASREMVNIPRKGDFLEFGKGTFVVDNVVFILTNISENTIIVYMKDIFDGK